MAVNLNIFVSDIAAALGSFDVVRVERSLTGEGGPYVEITKLAPADSATLLASNGSPYPVSAKTLSFLLDNLPQTDVVFTGVDPLTVDQVKDQINAEVGATIGADDTGVLRLTSTLLGTASKLEIVASGALVDLGFVAGDRDIGSEPYVPLVTGVSNYAFTDDDGQAGYFYRVRFFHTTTGQVSDYSSPFQGAPGTQISAGSLSVGSLDLVDQQGVAWQGQRVTFVSINQPLQVEGFAVALNRASVTIETDNAGHAEISLVRGLEVRVVFEGTSLIRDITIPDTPTFNLLTLIEGVPDIFEVVVPNLPAAPRRTL